jgi:hypothetical protein
MARQTGVQSRAGAQKMSLTRKSIPLALPVLLFLSTPSAIAQPADTDVSVIDTSQVPVYTRAMWLQDSLATLDLVVSAATLHLTDQNSSPMSRACLAVHTIEYGSPDPNFQPEPKLMIELVPPYRVRPDTTGIWLLQRTAHGYLVINPTDAPLTQTEWHSLSSSLPPPDDLLPPLVAHISGSGLYHTYFDNESQRDIRHGPQIGLASDGVCTQLYERGEVTLYRWFEADGRLRSIRRTITGTDIAFFLRYQRGRLWQFGWFKNGKRTGLSKTYYRREPDQIEEEIHFLDGVRHGPYRKWDPNGTLVSEFIYEEGFIPPIIRYHGQEKPVAKIYKSDDRISYGAPREIMDALKVGMTTQEVSEFLRLDFSEATGIFFPCYSMDTYLKVIFEDGKIAHLESAWNGICIERRD